MDLPGEVREMVYEELFVKRPNHHDWEGVVNVCGFDFWSRYVDASVSGTSKLRTDTSIL